MRTACVREGAASMSGLVVDEGAVCQDAGCSRQRRVAVVMLS
jgi:hypothetical protein